MSTEAKKQSRVKYQNNPFYVATDGLKLFFGLALSVAILTMILSAFNFSANLRSAQITPSNQSMQMPAKNFDELRETTTSQIKNKISMEKQAFLQRDTSEWIAIAALIAFFGLIAIFATTLVAGAFDYAAARISKNKSVNLSEALRHTLKQFFPYLWLRILVAIKIALWSLLFIVPGVIMAVRYSLAGVSFFDKNLSANQATKDSSRIVKGAWLTTNASNILFNTITLGIMNPILKPGTNAVLYSQLSVYDQSSDPKPAAHALSWIVFLLQLFGALIFAAIGVLIVIALYAEAA